MSDKAIPKELKDFEVERGFTKRPPIPYIPIEDEVGESVKKASGASEYKFELPGGTKVQHTLWDSGNSEAFLKHVTSAVSYVKRKGYFKEYEAAEREAGRAVYEAKIAKDLWLAAPMLPEETESPEFTASKNADLKVVDKNHACVKVAGKIFVLYENFLSKNTRSKWTTIVASQIGANPWTDLRGTVQSEPRSPSVQSFEDCVTFHLLTVFPQDTAEQERYYVNVHLKKPGRVLICHFVG
jgi:hypothetical protein